MDDLFINLFKHRAKAYYDERPRDIPDNCVQVTEVTKCIRASYYDRVFGRGLPKLTTYFGSLIHDDLLKTFDKYEIEVCKPPLYGIADAIYTIDGVEFVIELKTVKTIPITPYPNHIEQINTYMGMLEIYNGVIVYIDRAIERVKTFTVRFNESMYYKTIEKAHTLLKAIERNDPPYPTDYGYCSLCEHRKICPYSLF